MACSRTRDLNSIHLFGLTEYPEDGLACAGNPKIIEKQLEIEEAVASGDFLGTAFNAYDDETIPPNGSSDEGDGEEGVDTVEKAKAEFEAQNRQERQEQAQRATAARNSRQLPQPQSDWETESVDDEGEFDADFPAEEERTEDEVEPIQPPQGQGRGPVIVEIPGIDDPEPDPDEVRQRQDVQLGIKVEQMFANVPKGDHSPYRQQELQKWGFVKSELTSWGRNENVVFQFMHSAEDHTLTHLGEFVGQTMISSHLMTSIVQQIVASSDGEYSVLDTEFWTQWNRLGQAPPEFSLPISDSVDQGFTLIMPICTQGWHHWELLIYYPFQGKVLRFDSFHSLDFPWQATKFVRLMQEQYGRTVRLENA